MHNKLIDINPFNKLKLSFKLEKNLPKIILEEELKKIFNYLIIQYENANTNFLKGKSLRNILIFELLLLLSTGIRINELCNLKIENINISEKTILILGKGKKERIIYIGNLDTFNVLVNYISTYRKNSLGYLFVGQNDEECLREQSVRFILKNICNKLNIDKKITPHMFRHTFATMLLDRDVDIRCIQSILGHSSITTTQIYTYVSSKKQKEILTYHNPINFIKK